MQHDDEGAVDPSLRSGASAELRLGRAFTLVELLVVVGVVGVLIGLLIPVLSGARFESVATARQASQRQLMSALGMYASDFDDGFPYLGTPGEPERWLTAWGRLYMVRNYFGGQKEAWPTLLWPGYIEDTGDDRRSHPAPGAYPTLDAALRPMRLVYTMYWMTACAFADSAYWIGENPPSDMRLLRGTRRSEVKFPSAKGVLLDVGHWKLDGSDPTGTGALGIAWADGSASRPRLSLVDESWVVSRPFGSTPWRVIATRGGLAGRDQ